MFSRTYSDTTLSFALTISAAAWGMYWFPLRAIEQAGFSGAWSVVFFNACPMLVLCPLILVNRKQLSTVLGPTIFTAVMIGLAFSFYANGLV
ncbi:MAG: hypothetical protein P8M25_05620 [Paracoccaceae bacterium]|nr:hypothetical protein [Paracoccaceae bacterium]